MYNGCRLDIHPSTHQNYFLRQSVKPLDSLHYVTVVHKYLILILPYFLPFSPSIFLFLNKLLDICSWYCTQMHRRLNYHFQFKTTVIDCVINQIVIWRFIRSSLNDDTLEFDIRACSNFQHGKSWKLCCSIDRGRDKLSWESFLVG